MNHQHRFRVKIADQEREFDLIHRLNYRTFVEEIPQHAKNETGRLVDKFHDQNIYIICMDGEKLAGSIAVRENRPFSLDSKVPHLDVYLSGYQHICEIRLLMVDRAYRTGNVFYYLAEELARYCFKMKYDCAIMSGTTRQRKLYQHIGFTPFYHLVGTGDALFQPMYITPEKLAQGIGRLFRKKKVFDAAVKQVNLLPGPVEIHSAVKAEYEKTAVSHRKTPQGSS